MKRTRLLCLICCLLVCLPVLSAGKKKRGPEFVRTGLKVGANITAFEGGREFVDRVQNALNYQGGLAIQFNLNQFFTFQPEMLFITKGAEVYNDGTNPTFNYIKLVLGKNIPNQITLHTAYVEMPLNLQMGLRLGGMGRIFVFGGPYVSYLLSDKSTDYQELYNEIKDVVAQVSQSGAEGLLHEFDYGLGFGGGLESGSIQLTAKYDYGYSEFKQRLSRWTQQDVNVFSGLKNRNISVSLIWFF